MSLILKLWERRRYTFKALCNWGLHFFDISTFHNRGNSKNKKIIIFVRAISDIRLFKQAKALKNTGEFYTIFNGVSIHNPFFIPL